MARIRWLAELFVIGALVAGCAAPGPARIMDLAWDELPALPPAAGQTRQAGLASPFAGMHSDALLVAGGANFPDKLPWQGGAKVWWDDIYVLEHATSGAPRWVAGGNFKLPRPIAYGVSVDLPEGVMCIGGCDAERCYADCFLLAWDPAARVVRRTDLPSLPQPLAFMTAAVIGRTVYVAGGQHTVKGAVPSSVFWALDLTKPAEARWITLPTWPGPARVLAVGAAQRTPAGDEFFLFSGRTPQAGRPTQILKDAYAYNPATQRWRTLPPVGGGAGVSVMAGTAAANGRDEILVFGGDRGDLFLELESHDLAIDALRAKLAAVTDASRNAIQADIDRHLQAKQTIYESHPGFGRDVFALNTQTNTWRIVAQSPLPPQVTTLAVRAGDAIVIPSGEVRPGVRTSHITRAKPRVK